MKKQLGMSLSGLLGLSALLIVVALAGFKIFPAYMEYLKVKRAVTEIARAPEGGGSIGAIRTAFERRAAIESISAVNSNDLEVIKQGNSIRVSASWSVKVPLFSNISACMDFEARSE